MEEPLVPAAEVAAELFGRLITHCLRCRTELDSVTRSAALADLSSWFAAAGAASDDPTAPAPEPLCPQCQVFLAQARQLRVERGIHLGA